VILNLTSTVLDDFTSLTNSFAYLLNTLRVLVIPPYLLQSGLLKYNRKQGKPTSFRLIGNVHSICLILVIAKFVYHISVFGAGSSSCIHTTYAMMTIFGSVSIVAIAVTGTRRCHHFSYLSWPLHGHHSRDHGHSWVLTNSEIRVCGVQQRETYPLCHLHRIGTTAFLLLRLFLVLSLVWE
jgi:hypothetical protein